MKLIERICKEYDLPMLTNHITDLEPLFRMKYNRGYSTRFAEKQLGISTDEEADWRHLDIAGKTYIALKEAYKEENYIEQLRSCENEIERIKIQLLPQEQENKPS